MNIHLKDAKTVYKKRLRVSLSFLLVAGVVGIVGLWISGMHYHHAGDGIMSQEIRISVDPVVGITTVLWAVCIWRHVRAGKLRERKYRQAIADKKDIFAITDDGVEWGCQDITYTKVSWEAIGYYAISKKDVSFGLPSSSIDVNFEDLEDFDVAELESFLKRKGVRKID